MSADAIGAIMQGIGEGTNAVTGAVETGVNQQARPDIMLKNARNKYTQRMGALKRIVGEIKEVEATKAERLAWLRNDSDARTWHGVASNGWREKGKTSYGAWKDDRIYKDPLKAIAYKNYVKPGGEADKKIDRMRTSRASAEWNTPDTGNIAHFREEGRKSWNDLIQAEAIRDFLLAYQGLVLWQSSEVLSPENLHLLWSNDAEARKDTERGVVPFEARNRVLTQIINLAAMGAFPATYRPPVWVYGLTPDEQRKVSVGPTVGVLVGLVDARFTQNLLGSGAAGVGAYGAVGVRAAYGAAAPSSTGDLQSMVRSMLLESPSTLARAEQQVQAAPTTPPPPTSTQELTTRIQEAKENPVIPPATQDDPWAWAKVAGAIAATGAAGRVIFDVAKWWFSRR